jgi:uracil-DNA glycosylase family 4
LQIHNDGFPGKVLLSTLQQAGINIEDVWFTNMVMCNTLDGKSPGKDSLSMCHNRLMSEIKYVNPENVLLMGESACMGILGRKLAYSEGRRFEKDGRVYIPTYSPQLFYKNWNLYRDFSKAISKLNKPWIKQNPFHENYTVAVCEQDVLNWVNKYKEKNPLVSIDIETFGKTARNGILHSIGLAINKEDVIIIPVRYFNRSAIQSLFTILICQGVNFLAHNSDFEYSWINKFYDVRLPFKHDTFLYSYTIDERGGDDGEFTFSSGTHKLKNIVCKEYDIEDWSIDLENVFTLPEDEVYSYLNKDVQANFLALEICNRQDINTSPYTNIMIPSIPFMSHISNAKKLA